MLESRWGAKVKDFLKLLHEYASILRYKVIFAHGSRFELNLFVSPGVCVSVLIVSSQLWSTGILRKGFVGPLSIENPPDM